ncbi:unnamed protein product [Meloidogyne enterolobii]|uniref:Uncharacterized protein n=1 Tax=Meloidogyne enterolobii TaxID=390850 RepID=A0ACB1AFX5_MELEN
MRERTDTPLHLPTTPQLPPFSLKNKIKLKLIIKEPPLFKNKQVCVSRFF